MSPKVVIKEKRKKEIALAALNFLYEHKLSDFSISSFVSYLGLGKSSLYHYFNSKEEILDEAFYLISMEYVKDCEKKLEKENLCFKEKLEIIFDFYLVDNKSNKWFRSIYLEYLKLFVNSEANKKHYKTELLSQYQALFTKVVQSEIERNEIKPIALDFVNSLLTSADGMLIYSYAIESFDLKKELEKHIDSFIKLVKN